MEQPALQDRELELEQLIAEKEEMQALLDKEPGLEQLKLVETDRRLQDKELELALVRLQVIMHQLQVKEQALEVPQLLVQKCQTGVSALWRRAW